MNKIIGIEMGPLAEKLTKQIKGLPKIYDKYDEAISILYVANIITPKEAEKARDRLGKKVFAYMKNKNDK